MIPQGIDVESPHPETKREIAMIEGVTTVREEAVVLTVPLPLLLVMPRPPRETMPVVIVLPPLLLLPLLHRLEKPLAVARVELHHPRSLLAPHLRDRVTILLVVILPKVKSQALISSATSFRTLVLLWEPWIGAYNNSHGVPRPPEVIYLSSKI